MTERQGEMMLEEGNLGMLERAWGDREKSRQILDALCVNYSAAYCCDLKHDYMEVVKRKSYSHSAQEKNNLQNRHSYSEWIQYAYDHLVIHDSAPEYLEIFDAHNLMQRLEQEDCFVHRHKTRPNEAGMEYFETTVVRLYQEADSFIVILGYRPIDDIVAEEKARQEKLELALHIAETANRAKTDFLRRMSHDIRTPINGILGMIEMENRHPTDYAKLQECRNKILTSAEYLASLVDNVLDMGKVEAGGFVLERKSFDLIPLLMKQIAMVELQAGEHGLNFYGGKEMSIIHHRHLIGSPIHLNRVLMNLANNAIKYNRAGGDVTVYCKELSCDGETAVYEFVCADTGQGMSEAFQKRAFEPFAQEGKTSISTYNSSGLGLSIVKEMVTQMGGRIDLVSENGKGSTFTIVLPFALDHEAEQQAEQHAGPNAVEVAGRTALLVEDNELNREIAEMILEDEGLVLTSVENGLEAVNVFADSVPFAYDYIFMDITMPVMDGLEATRRIRAMDRPDAKRVPILAMSANAFQEDVQQSMAAGMNAYIPKPVDIALVRRALQEHLPDYDRNNEENAEPV